VKAFGLLAVAVLAVIGIGVGLVGGLISAQTFPLPPARTYSLSGVRFSVAFPVPLQSTRLPTALACLIDGGERASAGHLNIQVQTFGFAPASLTPCIKQLGSNGGGYVSSGTARATSFKTVGHVRSCPAPRQSHDQWFCYGFGNEYSLLGSVTVPDGLLSVLVISTEGLPAAEAVTRSFRVLSTAGR
jgi:hypothetical protein